MYWDDTKSRRNEDDVLMMPVLKQAVRRQAIDERERLKKKKLEEN